MTPSMRPMIGFDMFCEARKLVVRLEHSSWKESFSIDKEQIKKKRNHLSTDKSPEQYNQCLILSIINN